MRNLEVNGKPLNNKIEIKIKTVKDGQTWTKPVSFVVDLVE